jgi:hypothetical protein
MNSTNLYPTKAAAVLSVVTIVVSLVAVGFLVGRFAGLKLGVEQGVREAINVRNPSERLEMACAGLWIGDQNKKYFEKYGGNK